MAEINYQTIHAACQQDAKYKELMQRTRDYHKERSEYKQKQRESIRKIIQFDHLEDVALDRMGDCEGDKHTKTIRNVTGMDQECWFWRWSGAQDLCFDGMVQAAIDVSNAETMMGVIMDKIKVNKALLDSREEEIKAKLEKEAKEA